MRTFEYVTRELDTTRQTAARYLDELAAAGLITKHRVGKHNYYINDRLVDLFFEVSVPVDDAETIESGIAA